MSQELFSIIIPYEALGKNEKFESTLLEAIDEALSPLGKDVKDTIYNALETKYMVTKDEIPCKIEAFTQTIEFLFGQAARLIEIRIIQTLNREVKDFIFKPQTEGLVFVEYVTALREHMDKQNYAQS